MNISVKEYEYTVVALNNKYVLDLHIPLIVLLVRKVAGSVPRKMRVRIFLCVTKTYILKCKMKKQAR